MPRREEWSVRGATKKQRQAVADGLDDTRSWVDPNGYRLSDRLWLGGAADRRAIDNVLRKALAQGMNPLDAAEMLTDYLTPEGLAQSTYKPFKSPHQRTWGVPATGNYSARRLARTEMARAYGAATLAAAARNPWTAGVKWNLSITHTDDDACDEKAHDNPDGLGPGVYLVENFPRYPDHPHCMCYISQQAASFDDVLAAAKAELEMGPWEDTQLHGSPQEADAWNYAADMVEDSMSPLSLPEVDELRRFVNEWDATEQELLAQNTRAVTLLRSLKREDFASNGLFWRRQRAADRLIAYHRNKWQKFVDSRDSELLDRIDKAGQAVQDVVRREIDARLGVGHKDTARLERTATRLAEELRDNLNGWERATKEAHKAAYESTHNGLKYEWITNDAMKSIRGEEYVKAWTDAHRSVVARLRQVGSDQTVGAGYSELGRTTGTQKALDSLNRVRDVVPTDWWEATASGGKVEFHVTDRAFYKSSKNAFGVNPGQSDAVWVHEYGHQLEAFNGNVSDAGKAFWKQRAGVEANRPLNVLEKNDRFRPDEIGVRDNFADVYLGKTYGATSDHTELVSMGLQHTIGGSDPSIVLADNGLWRFVLGVLAGL